MTIEEKLKELILSKYSSIREFAIDIDVPYTTITSIFSRGIGNSSVTNIIKICKPLGISVDELAEGNIVPIRSYQKSTERIFEVKDILEDVKDQLSTLDGLTFDGKPANKDSIDSIVDAMDIGVEMAKRKIKY